MAMDTQDPTIMDPNMAHITTRQVHHIFYPTNADRTMVHIITSQLPSHTGPYFYSS